MPHGLKKIPADEWHVQGKEYGQSLESFHIMRVVDQREPLFFAVPSVRGGKSVLHCLQFR
jgi:hypothetical protein